METFKRWVTWGLLTPTLYSTAKFYEISWLSVTIQHVSFDMSLENLELIIQQQINTFSSFRVRLS